MQLLRIVFYSITKLKLLLLILFIFFCHKVFSQTSGFERYFAIATDYNYKSSLSLGIAVGKYDHPGAWAGEKHQILISLKEIRYDYQLCQNFLLFGYDINYGFTEKNRNFGIRPKAGIGFPFVGIYLGYNVLLTNDLGNYDGLTVGGGLNYPIFQKEAKTNRGLYGIIKLDSM